MEQTFGISYPSENRLYTIFVKESQMLKPTQNCHDLEN